MLDHLQYLIDAWRQPVIATADDPAYDNGREAARHACADALEETTRQFRRVLELAPKLLEMASETYSNHGCNDFPMENTDENWKLYQQVYSDFEGWDAEEFGEHERPEPGTPIYFQDHVLMDWIAEKLKPAEE